MTPSTDRNRSGGIPGWTLWVAAAVVVVVILVVAVLFSKDSGSSAEPEAWDEGAPVTVTGEALPPLPDDVGGLVGDPAGDAALGRPGPTLAGTDARTGEPVELAPTPGKGRILLVMAHWCPHCQAEVPRIVEHLAESPLPDDVELVGLATRLAPGENNYPSSAWLAREDWTAPTLIDDANTTAGVAVGLSGLPFFIVTDAEGTVVARASGELTTEGFDHLVELAQG